MKKLAVVKTELRITYVGKFGKDERKELDNALSPILVLVAGHMTVTWHHMISYSHTSDCIRRNPESASVSSRVGNP